MHVPIYLLTNGGLPTDDVSALAYCTAIRRHSKIENFLARTSDARMYVHPDMEALLLAIIRYKPMWVLDIMRLWDQRAVKIVQVYADTELLGLVDHTMCKFDAKGQRCSEFSVSSHRIHKRRGTANTYCTKSVDNAFAKIKKTFARRSPSERLVNAEDLASKKVSELVTVAASKHTRATGTIDRLASEFARDNYEQFRAYAAKHARGTEYVEEYEAATVAMKTIDDIRSMFHANQTALLICDEGEYIVRYKHNVNIYNNEDLPNTLRGKLGMLKLVDPGMPIADIGIKCNTETYLIVVDPDGK